MTEERNAEGRGEHVSVQEMFEELNSLRSSRPWYRKLLDHHTFPGLHRLRYRYGIGAMRNVYQRARYGFGYRDLWNFPEYITGLIGKASGDLADSAHGWPQSEEFPEFQDWVGFLYGLRDDLSQYSTDSVEFYGGYSPGDYEKHREYDLKNQARAQAAMERFAQNWTGMWD